MPGTNKRMFGLGIREILLTAIIVAVVWYGFKILSRNNTSKKTYESESGARGATPAPLDMQACPGCGVYVAPGELDCGTSECTHSKS